MPGKYLGSTIHLIGVTLFGFWVTVKVINTYGQSTDNQKAEASNGVGRLLNFKSST